MPRDTGDARSMPRPTLLERNVYETYESQRLLGVEVEHHAAFVAARLPAHPRIYDANAIAHVRAASPADIDAVLKGAEDALGDLDYRKFYCDGRTPEAFEAHLVSHGYECERTEQRVLSGPLIASGHPTPEALRIVPTSSEADWARLADLQARNFEESGVRDDAQVPDRLADHMVAYWRRKTPTVTFWLAYWPGDPQACAFVSSWAGRDGLGMIEYLYTAPERRRSGIATGLIAQAVDSLRRAEIGPILIGAEPELAPGRMYAALGFEWVCETREWLRVGSSERADQAATQPARIVSKV